MGNEELVLRYQKYGDKDALQQIINNFKPLVNQKVNYYAANMPKEYLIPEANILVAQAVKNYDSSKGSIAGHINNHLMGLSRVVNNASPIYVPEIRVNKMRSFIEEQEEMSAMLKRPPTIEELSDRMSLSMKEIERLGQETNKTLITGEDLPEIIINKAISERGLLEFVHNRLIDSREKSILEMTYGMHGSPIVKTDAVMANKLGVSQTTVRNLKDNIIKIMREYS